MSTLALPRSDGREYCICQRYAVRFAIKRAFDIILAGLGLVLTGWIIPLLLVLSALDTRKWGLFAQWRVGRHCTSFQIIKIRTMREHPSFTTTVTTAHDIRITKLGRWLRRLKLDELPQLLNVLRGEMSIVGPRPDVPGYYDKLQGEDRRVLCLRPGITGPATLYYRHEESLLASQADPEAYNRDVIFPSKVAINLSYLDRYSPWQDLAAIWRTVIALFH